MVLARGTLNSMILPINNFNIYARLSNKKAEGDTVVLVHGLGVSGRYFVPLGEYLSPLYNVYIPDLPGFGKSADPGYILNLRELSEALCAFIETLGLVNPILLGNSFGCHIIIDYLVNHGMQAKNIILTGPTIDEERRTLGQQVKMWFKNAAKEPLSLLPLVVKDYLHCGIRRFIRTIHYALEDEVEKKLPEITLPTLIVRGEEDQLTLEKWARKICSLIPGAYLATIPDKGHATNYSAPKELAQLVHHFILSPHSFTSQNSREE